MTNRAVVTLLTLLLAISCSPNDEEDIGTTTMFVVDSDPTEAAETPAPLADGDVIEGALSDESRDAVLVILEGLPSPAAEEPVKFGFIKAFDSPQFIDVDPEPGPEQWVTVAEVQDADGEVLWSDQINSLYQLLRYLELVLNQQSDLAFGVDQVFAFVKMQYPQLLEFAVRVPTGIEGGVDYVLKVPKLDEEGVYEAFRMPIDELVDAKTAPELTGDVATIVDNGPSEDQIDVVIIGDGYTAEDRERFEGDAQAIADRFGTNEPFESRMNVMNFHTVFTPSTESGAGYDCTGIITADNGCKNDLRDTVFEMVFVISAIADRFNLDIDATSARVAMPLQVARLYEVSAAVPFDEIIMVSNTRRTSGFAGLYISVLTANDGRLAFPDTAVHEFGHAFGVLGDEYEVEGDPCLYAEPEIPLPANISSTAKRDELKWAHLVEEDTPLPTEDSDIDVGAFSGAYNCAEMYRPHHNCKMRDSDKTFCAACSEQLVTRMYTYFDASAFNGPTTASRDGDELVFEVTPRDESVGVQWMLGDEEVGDEATLRLAGADLPGDWTELTVRLFDATGFVVAHRPRAETTTSWWVRK